MGASKPGQQHVADDQEGDARVGLVWVVEIELPLEVLDGIDFLGMFAGRGDDRPFVGPLGRNHHDRFQERDASAQVVVAVVAVVPAGWVASPHRLGLFVGQPLGQRLVDVLLVVDRRHLGATNHLGLEPVGQDVFDVVIHDVGGDGFDPLLGFQQIARGAPFLLQRQDFFGRPFLHQVIESLRFSSLAIRFKVSTFSAFRIGT